jgi:hypothetical protein
VRGDILTRDDIIKHEKQRLIIAQTRIVSQSLRKS